MLAVLLYVLLLEAGIVAGSGIDSWARGDDYTWFGRWVWWHLAPLWALVLLGVRCLEAATRRWAGAAVLRFEQARALLTLVAPETE